MSKTKIIYCKICKIAQHVDIKSERTETVCVSCQNKKWFMRMKKRGCSVPDPKNLGDTPFLELKQKEDYPRVVVDGVKYIDMTGYFFEDTKYKREYLTREQQKRREEEKIKEIIRDLVIDYDNKLKLDRAERDKLIKQLYKGGYSQYKITKVVKCSASTVSLVVNRAIKNRELEKRVEPSLKNQLTIERRNEKVKEMYLKGCSYAEITDELGCSSSVISKLVGKWIKEGEVERRGNGKIRK